MNHLSDEILNEYLDDALPPDTRAEVESHLRDCADCELRLDRLADLFFELSALPEAGLTRDLSADVVRTLTPQPLLLQSICLDFGLPMQNFARCPHRLT